MTKKIRRSVLLNSKPTNFNGAIICKSSKVEPIFDRQLHNANDLIILNWFDWFLFIRLKTEKKKMGSVFGRYMTCIKSIKSSDAEKSIREICLIEIENGFAHDVVHINTCFSFLHWTRCLLSKKKKKKTTNTQVRFMLWAQHKPQQFPPKNRLEIVFKSNQTKYISMKEKNKTLY